MVNVELFDKRESSTTRCLCIDREFNRFSLMSLNTKYFACNQLGMIRCASSAVEEWNDHVEREGSLIILQLRLH